MRDGRMGEICTMLGIEGHGKGDLIFEFSDPLREGKKRDRSAIHYLIHDGRLWKTTWMNRVMNPGFIRYGANLVRSPQLQMIP